MKSTAISPTDAFSKLLWSILQVFVLLWELTSVLAIIVGKETNPNSNMKLTIFKNNICFIKTKNDNTPLPKRPARKYKLNKRDWDLRFGRNVKERHIFREFCLCTVNLSSISKISREGRTRTRRNGQNKRTLHVLLLQFVNSVKPSLNSGATFQGFSLRKWQVFRTWWEHFYRNIRMRSRGMGGGGLERSLKLFLLHGLVYFVRVTLLWSVFRCLENENRMNKRD